MYSTYMYIVTCTSVHNYYNTHTTSLHRGSSKLGCLMRQFHVSYIQSFVSIYTKACPCYCKGTWCTSVCTPCSIISVTWVHISGLVRSSYACTVTLQKMNCSFNKDLCYVSCISYPCLYIGPSQITTFRYHVAHSTTQNSCYDKNFVDKSRVYRALGLM